MIHKENGNTQFFHGSKRSAFGNADSHKIRKRVSIYCDKGFKRRFSGILKHRNGEFSVFVEVWKENGDAVKMRLRRNVSLLTHGAKIQMTRLAHGKPVQKRSKFRSPVSDVFLIYAGAGKNGNRHINSRDIGFHSFLPVKRDSGRGEIPGPVKRKKNRLPLSDSAKPDSETTVRVMRGSI